MTPSGGARRKLTEYRRKRDFTRTQEPSGDAPVASPDALRFVIQKHAASHLHFDFRLELDGVMKSWAVPKGPSLDPAVKRLAMEVEDHPIAYNSFEGTIPKGQYGGGTVMLWDRGTYDAADATGTAGVAALRRGYEKGKLDLVLQGERLRGGWSLVRMKRASGDKPQWLLVKRDDDTAEPGSDVVAGQMTSIDSGRTMEQIASGRSRVWNSDRAGGDDEGKVRKTTKRSTTVRSRTAAKGPAPKGAGPRLQVIEPMKAGVAAAVPAGEGWTYEPKYDGIRVIAYATSAAARIITRNGNDKSTQFPEVVAALRTLAARAKRPLVLDGEIVALDGDEAARFQDLQSRMHATDRDFIETAREGAPAAFVAFDLLVDGDEPVIREPWTRRRARLEQRLRNRTSPTLRLTESVPDDGEEMLARARRAGWEGVIAKRTSAPYVPGARSKDWLKLKIEHRQEFVIGGYTEPRNTREHIGALLLGYYDDDDDFIYVGHTGGGFTRAGLKEMYERLAPAERKTSPFTTTPKTNERAHWVTPKVVVEVKFGEWTSDGKLRQPIFLGVRDDKPAREVGRERESVQRRVTRRRTHTGAAAMQTKRARAAEPPALANVAIVEQLRAVEQDGGDGAVRLGRGTTLKVSSLDREIFPGEGITKGTLLRYYASVAPLILPSMKDRPLVLKRMPAGIGGETFFQQKAPDSAQESVRVETVEDTSGDRAERLVGGALSTLLYTVQIGCISTDPWHSRVGSLDAPDYTYLDLDPGPKATFARVHEVAVLVKAEMDALGLKGALKTSGSRGLHVAIPLPAGAGWETALTLAQIVAMRVATAHPAEATVVRTVADRPPGAIYVDYLQNVRGKSVAGAYCVRAKMNATVSTPLEWAELEGDLDPREFTVLSAPARFAEVGDLWRAGLKQKNPAALLRGLASSARVRQRR